MVKCVIEKRKVEIEPKYYLREVERSLAGYTMLVKFSPFNGREFIQDFWCNQSDRLWIRDSAVGGGFPEASVFSDPNLSKMKEEEEGKGKGSLLLGSFRFPLSRERYMQDSEELSVHVPCSIETKGKWIGNSGFLTALETTKVHVKFLAEEKEVILPPGTVAMMSPITLMTKVKDNIEVKSLTKITQILRHMEKEISTSRTTEELAKRLRLEKVKVDNGIMRDYF